MQRIIKAEKRENVLILVALSCISLIGVAFCFLFYNRSIILMLLTICVTILCILQLIKRFQVVIYEEMPLKKLLLKEPQKVVWVYSMVTQRMPFGFQINQSGTMYFKLIDGNEITLSLPVSELKGISEMLNYHLPHASFGYSKEKEQWYLAHPAMLMKK